MFQVCFVLAGVVGGAGWRLEGELLRLDIVAAAHIGGVDAELVGDHFDGALHVIDCFWPAGASISGDRHGIGEDVAGFEVHRLDVVVAGGHQAGQVGDVVEGRVGAELADDMHAQAEDSALVVEGDRDIGDLGAAVSRRDEMFDAGAGPFQRHIVKLRQLGDHDLFRIELVLDAEAAADIGRDHANGAFGQAQDAGQRSANAVGNLCACPKR